MDKKDEDHPCSVDEPKVNAAAPHNASTVYAFSCMFYTKLTEVSRTGRVTKAVSSCCNLAHLLNYYCIDCSPWLMLIMSLHDGQNMSIFSKRSSFFFRLLLRSAIN